MPLGGAELHSGYKGYGLGMLVEVFCGIMSGKLTLPKSVLVPVQKITYTKSYIILWSYIIAQYCSSNSDDHEI